MEECRFSAGEFVYKESDYDDLSIYIIVSGKVEECLSPSPNFTSSSSVTNNNNLINNPNSHSQIRNNNNSRNEKSVVRDISDNEYFGEVAFFTGQVRESGIKVLSFSKMFKLKRETFISVLSTS
jgi:CRP-like cAMP-binding protein